MRIDMKEVFDIIDVEVSEVERNITNTAGRLIIFRLCSKYGEKLNVQIRGTFNLFYDKLLESRYISRSLTSSSLDIGLKQMLYNFGIYFTDKTSEGIDETRSSPRRLLILDDWVGIDEFVKIRESNNNLAITDLFITSMHENSEYEDLLNIFNNSRYLSPEIWYEQNDYNLYSNQSARDKAYEAKYSEEEIRDITYDLIDILNAGNIKSSTYIDLLKFGEELFNSEIKCVKFRGHAGAINYSSVYVAFLIYLAEEFRINVNTEIDADFCEAYAEYRSGSYCLSEDLFSLINDIVPVMYFVKKSNKRLVFIRDLICAYTYTYVTDRELELMILGDTSIKMKDWYSGSRTDFKEQGFVHKDNIRKSAFVDRYIEGNLFLDIDIVPIYEVLKSEEKIKETIDAFNSYNVRVTGGAVRKCITVRDLLCRKVKDGNNEVIQIGFVYSPNKYDFDYRLKLSAKVSEVNDNDMNIIRQSYFTFMGDNICRLFNIDYIFNLFEKAPRSILELIHDTCDITEYDDDDDGGYSNDDDYDAEDYCSVPEKFLYYKLTEKLQNSNVRDDIIDIPEAKMELKASRFSSVYTASEIIPELAYRFGIANIIDSEVIDIYGNINTKFLGANSKGKYFDIRNELFGVMK